MKVNETIARLDRDAKRMGTPVERTGLDSRQFYVNPHRLLTYKPGAVFSPRQIRDILRPLDVGVTQFQIGARGRVVEENGKPFFATGKDKFLIAADGRFADLPRNVTIFVEAILNDKAQPMEIKILDFKR